MAGCNSSTNMQLFQEMKYKFPDIPEEVIQNCIFKHSGNREACIQLLSKESLNYIYPSIETHFPTSHHYSINVHSKLPIVKNGSNLYLRNSLLPTSPSHIYPNSAKPKMGRCSFSYFSPISSVPCNESSTGRPREIQSAPTIQSKQNPFLSAYNNEWHFNINSVCNPVVLNTSPCKKNISNQMTTQNMQSRLTVNTPSGISPNIMDNQVSNPTVTQARHVTTLKINPQPVYLIEKYGYNPSSSVFTNVMPSGRHMTSVNLQLRPPSSEAQPPIEITTTPLNCAMSKNNDKDFNSQVRISINSAGATLTAMRTQKKPPLVSPTSHHSISMQRNVTHVSTVPTFSSNANIFKNTEASEHFATESYNVAPQNCSQFQPLSSENLINMQEPWNTINQSVLPYQITSTNQQRENAYNELAYTQALLLHQKARLEVLQKVLDDEKKILSRMKMEVNNMEEHLLQRRLNLTAMTNMTDVQNLREENRRLRVECHCLSMEVDFCLKGQAPLGETDEDFYKHIFTGPLGPIPPLSNTEELNSQAMSAAAFQSNKETGTENQNMEEKDVWKCSICTFANHPALNKCEMCEMMRTTDSGYKIK